MTNWVDSATVKKYALVKWSSLNYDEKTSAPFANEAAFDTFLTSTLIPRAQGHINAFCKRDFDTDYPDGVPGAIADVAARAAANMIQYLVMNRMGPLIQTGDFKVKIPTQAVLTDELKALLAPWVKLIPYTKGSKYQTRQIEDRWGEMGEGEYEEDAYPMRS
jgi:hypothetical protein